IKDGADHCSFLDRNIPGVLFTTGLHSEYHTPIDDIDKINFAGMVLIADYMEVLLLNMHRRKNLAQLFLRKQI
ncbi:MAG: M28 family peptidase, partial [Bacteroidia bacterium]